MKPGTTNDQRPSGTRPGFATRLLSTSLALLSIQSFLFGSAQKAAVETQEFACRPGDTLVIENDYGRVQVRTWDNNQVSARIRKIAADDSRLANVAVLSQKSGPKIYLHAYFYDYSSESVYIDVQVPVYLNVFVSGANPAVELYDLQGHVRVDTLTGLITAENLTSSVSLLTDSGDILYRCQMQPEGDIRLESIYGNIRCDVNGQLNFRGWARAGGLLSWNGEVELQDGFLERQVGVGGPLFLAGSTHGNVQLSLGRQAETPATSVPQRSSAQVLRPEGESPGNPAATSSASTSQPQPDEDGGGTPRPERQAEPVVTTENNAPSRPIRTASGAVDSGYSLKVNVDWIYLNVSVRDRYSNRAIPNLHKDDFVVYEDGVVQTVEKFESEEAPFNLLLLLDVSGSTREFIDLIKEASIRFTHEIKHNDRIAVAVFNSRVRLIQPFTSDRYEVASAIEQVRSGGGTAFYDALLTCIREYLAGIEGRKAIVVFSDGVDNQLTGDYTNGSRTRFDELYRDIQEIDSIIYTIFLDTERHLPQPQRRRTGGVLGDILEDILKGQTPPYNPPGRVGGDPAYQEARQQMQMIADQTGGRMYSPRAIQDLSHVYSEIADDLRVQYTLAYNSTNGAKDGRWREIKVAVPRRRDAVVRTRKGYYAARASR